jgi:hypothetical protein
MTHLELWRLSIQLSLAKPEIREIQNKKHVPLRPLSLHNAQCTMGEDAEMLALQHNEDVKDAE